MKQVVLYHVQQQGNVLHVEQNAIIEFPLDNRLELVAQTGDKPIYPALWRASHINSYLSKQLAQAIRAYIVDYITNPKLYLSVSNTTGGYKQFRQFLLELLDLCDKYPNAHYKVI